MYIYVCVCNTVNLYMQVTAGKSLYEHMGIAYKERSGEI